MGGGSACRAGRVGGWTRDIGGVHVEPHVGMGCQTPSLSRSLTGLGAGRRWCRGGDSNLLGGRFDLERNKHILFLQIEDTASPRFKAFFKVCVVLRAVLSACTCGGGGHQTAMHSSHSRPPVSHE